MTASQVANQIDVVELNALTADQQVRVWNVLHLGEINPFGVEVTLLEDIFGPSTTITNLKTARIERISRAQEIRIGKVSLKTLKLESIR